MPKPRRRGRKVEEVEALEDSIAEGKHNEVSFVTGERENSVTRQVSDAIENLRQMQVELLTQVRQVKEEFNEFKQSKLSQGNIKRNEVSSAVTELEVASAPMPIVAEEHRRSLHELPHFGGKPEEWPLFKTSFDETTKAYKYSNLENLIRLQKCLHNEARSSVEFLLIHPQNVTKIIEQLQLRYGRPESLIKTQIDKVKDISTIPENKLELIIPFATKINNLVGFMEAANAQQHLGNPMLLDELVNKLPMSKRLEWAKYTMELDSYATVKEFSCWLEDICKLVMRVSDPMISQPGRKHDRHNNTVLYVTNDDNKGKYRCILCNESHLLQGCVKYMQMSVENRWKTVKSHRLCFSCLHQGHNVFSCKRQKDCGKNGCVRKHHISLHEEPVTKTVLSFNNANQTISQKVLFRIVPVKIYGPNKTIKTYALLDEGSSVTLIDNDLATELQLKGSPETLNLQWIGGVVSSESSREVSLQISGISRSAKTFNLPNVYAVKNLNLPLQSLKVEELSSRGNSLKHLSFMNYTDAKPKILIGVDNCQLGIQETASRMSESGAVTVRTPLGWVVYGPVKTIDTGYRHILNISLKPNEDARLENIHQMVQDYLMSEEFSAGNVSKVVESEENKRAREIMIETAKKVGNNYEIGLLWKYDNVKLPDSLPLAQKRLEVLERKLGKTNGLTEKYGDKIKEYINKGYVRELTTEELNNRKHNVWYLPHFAVVNPNKPGKIRLVFDAAAKSNGTSLNDVLLSGPDINKPLITVLFNFRQGTIGVCADIKEMFHQVKIRPEDQHFQRFLWRERPDDDIRTYVMMVMIFGASCSPSLAQYIKNTNANTYRTAHPRAVEEIVEKHYVDDYVASFETEDEAVTVATEVKQIHAAGGFELRGFVSNSVKLMEKLNQDMEKGIETEKAMNKSERVLGMFWKTDSDEFRFNTQFHNTPPEVLSFNKKPTKRELLSIVMSVFDPFGLLGNIIIYGKLILQEAWIIGLDWNDQLPDNLYNKWKQWFQHLELVENLRVPRCYTKELLNAKEVQLHIFVDASEMAYAAVAYWRVTGKDGQVDIVFVTSRTRCAPQKLLSIPRLELQAAVLGVRLKKIVMENHTVKVDKCVLWSDSMTVISWVRSDHRRYKPFVAHRVAEILENSSVKEWNWLPSKINVADEATRTKYPIDYNVDGRWIRGPEFLREETAWPKQRNNTQQCLEELRRNCQYTLTTQNLNIVPELERFSKYERLKRTTAWIFRFVDNCRVKRDHQSTVTGELKVYELKRAEEYMCRIVQKTSFPKEYGDLVANKPIEKRSALHSLTPYLDDKGIIRMNGRLNSAEALPTSARNPIILPKNHVLTYLIVDYYHRKFHHHNQHLILCQVRMKFWIPHIKSVVRKVSRICQYCKVDKAKPNQPIMGQLPEDRTTPYVAPFTYTGLDYYGPVYVAIGRRQEKRWVVLFTCLTIRAVHIEIATDLSTDACIICLRNFINRRGVPVRIRSDNGTNFVGVGKELRHVTEFFDNSKIEQELSSYGVEWVFNCPVNPSSGGCWERLVQSVKRVLKYILKEVAPRPETLYSLLVEAENIINSRPLTDLPVTPEDEETLTPNHFLLGRVNSTQTPGPVDKRLFKMRKQWRIAQQLKNHFWRRWILEYLPELTRRAKWYGEPDARIIEEGSLVIIVDVDRPRKEWQRGRVVKVFPGTDGVIRVADVRTGTGTILRRPTSKLAVLDVIGESKNRSIHEGADVEEATTHGSTVKLEIEKLSTVDSCQYRQ